MKKVLIALMICVAVTCFAEEKKADSKSSAWSEDFVACQQKAAKTGKPIFALFTGSDWCIWCKRLEGEVLSQNEFLKYASGNLILFKADFPNKIPQLDELKRQNANLAKKYGIRGYPTVLLLDKKGGVIAKTGYRKDGPENYVKHVKSLLKNDK